MRKYKHELGMPDKRIVREILKAKISERKVRDRLRRILLGKSKGLVDCKRRKWKEVHTANYAE